MSDAQVLVGNDGWLFLNEGTNKSYSYLTGQEPIPHPMAMRWIRSIEWRQKLFPDCVHLICPEKLAVYPNKLAETQLSPARLACLLRDKHGAIYPCNELSEISIDAGATYSKTDTHFSDLGAFEAIRIVMSNLNIPINFVPEWSSISIIGDLGNKMVPVLRSQKVILKNPHPVTVSDNGLNNRGRITHFQNNLNNQGRMLIFGDSFSGINLARMAANFVTEVLFVHSLAVDFRIIEKFRPDMVVFEFAERFLREAPQDGLPVEKLIIDKMLSGEASKVEAWRKMPENPTLQFVDWDMIDFLLGQ